MVLPTRFVGSVLATLILASVAVPPMSAQPPDKLRKVNDVAPVYPDVARANQIEGTVIVQITVGTDGRVSDAVVIRSIPMLDAAALAAVRQWVYDPVGLSAPVRMVVTIPFSLKAAPQRVPVQTPARRTVAYAPAALSSRPVAYVGDELRRRLQAFAQGTTRRNWVTIHERLLISSERSSLVLSIVRKEPDQKSVFPDTVRIICGDFRLDLECSRVRVWVGGKDVAPVTEQPFPYTSASGIPDRMRVSATFHASDLRNGFTVRFAPPGGVESMYEISKTAAENDLLLGL